MNRKIAIIRLILVAISAFVLADVVLAAEILQPKPEVVKKRVEKPVRDSISIRQDTQKVRAEWLSEKQKMLGEIERIEAENTELTTRREQLVAQVSSAKERIASKEKELKGIRQITENIHPFLKETLAWLEAETGEGLPFLTQERKKRVGRLRALLDDPDVPVSEKFRKIMEALLIEAEYGTNVEVTSQSILLSGEPVLVNILRLGRLNLFYQTLDGSVCGYFNVAENGWKELAREYNRNIKLAMDMALKRRPVELVNLPVGRMVLQ